METIFICENKVIPASGVFYGPAVSVENLTGYFSVHAKIRGDGTAKFTYQVSLDLSSWRTPQNAPDILAGLTKTSGPGADGRVAEQFHPELAPYIRLVITETGGASALLVAADLVVK